MPAMSKMKRPAAVEDGALAGLKKGKFVQSSSSSSYMKRPAAAGGVKAAIDKMQAGCKVDDGDEAGDGSEADSTTRDKGKGEKFAAMMKANMLPNHVQHLYNEVAKTKSSPRDFGTQIINSLFDRKPNGRFELRDDKPPVRGSEGDLRSEVLQGSCRGLSPSGDERPLFPEQRIGLYGGLGVRGHPRGGRSVQPGQSREILCLSQAGDGERKRIRALVQAEEAKKSESPAS